MSIGLEIIWEALNGHRPYRRYDFHWNYDCKPIPLHCCYFSSSDENSELEILMDGRKGVKYREESLNVLRGINQTWSDDYAIQLCIKMRNHPSPNL